MAFALAQAKLSAKAKEVPIGAIVTLEGQVIGKGCNRTRRDGVISAHAEILALAAAEQYLGDFRLDNAQIYVTVEPCLMCLGAILQARITRLVFGAREPKFGALYSRFGMAKDPAFAKLEIVEGVLANQAVDLLQDFFGWLRKK